MASVSNRVITESVYIFDLQSPLYARILSYFAVANQFQGRINLFPQYRQTVIFIGKYQSPLMLTDKKKGQAGKADLALFLHTGAALATPIFAQSPCRDLTHILRSFEKPSSALATTDAHCHDAILLVPTLQLAKH